MNAQLLLAATKVQLLFGAAAGADTEKNTAGFSGILKNLTKSIQSWGDYIIILVGIVLIAYGAIALFKAIKGMGGQGGPGGMDWAKAILAIIIGIVLSVTSIGAIKTGAGIDGNTVKDTLSGNG